jgi:hypothetical protein
LSVDIEDNNKTIWYHETITRVRSWLSLDIVVDSYPDVDGSEGYVAPKVDKTVDESTSCDVE